ncbi:MAG: hypothetical protein J6386_06915 [Candidatus Synoicihabitans palmerolidicus]|nr:hypothetical protein [Candidatus Synoicihabitans palmerolidicus]
MVFSGYSTQDPVLHDTIRNVYEEMGRKRAAQLDPTPVDPENAPAYFLAYSDEQNDRQEFHGNEVLRAASSAVGTQTPSVQAEHPNYIRFVAADKHQSPRLQLDELMLWLQHQVLRNQQTNALQAELPGLMTRLLGHRPRPGEIECVCEKFANYVKAEFEPIEQSKDSRQGRRLMREVTAWSHGFHIALRREWAHADAHLRKPGQFRSFTELNHRMWYFPASEQPTWTAWSAVLELALVHLSHEAINIWQGEDTTGSSIKTIIPTLARKPCVLFRRNTTLFAQTVALSLEFPLPVSEKMRHPDSVPGSPSQHAIWTLTASEVPWKPAKPRSKNSPPPSEPSPPPTVPKTVREIACPTAGQIWDLALGKLDEPKPFVTQFLSP